MCLWFKLKNISDADNVVQEVFLSNAQTMFSSIHSDEHISKSIAVNSIVSTPETPPTIISYSKKT